jgi:hypothetical protein
MLAVSGHYKLASYRQHRKAGDMLYIPQQLAALSTVQGLTDTHFEEIAPQEANPNLPTP